MANEFVGAGVDDGLVLGRSATDKIGFYGLATPIVQRSSAAQSTLTLTTALTSGFGFTTSAGFVAMLAQLEEIRAALVAMGLMKGS